MAYLMNDRTPDPLERLFHQQRPRYHDPQKISINIKETPKTYIIEAALPGLSKEDIRVKVDADVLTIYVPTNEEKPPGGQQVAKQEAKQAEQPKSQEDPVTIYHRHEIRKRYAPRQVRLSQDANTHDVKAEYTDGILTIIITRDQKKAEKRSINVQ